MLKIENPPLEDAAIIPENSCGALDLEAAELAKIPAVWVAGCEELADK